jgi:hypothetical protein
MTGRQMHPRRAVVQEAVQIWHENPCRHMGPRLCQKGGSGCMEVERVHLTSFDFREAERTSSRASELTFMCQKKGVSTFFRKLGRGSGSSSESGVMWPVSPPHFHANESKPSPGGCKVCAQGEILSNIAVRLEMLPSCRLSHMRQAAHTTSHSGSCTRHNVQGL